MTTNPATCNPVPCNLVTSAKRSNPVPCNVVTYDAVACNSVTCNSVTHPERGPVKAYQTFGKDLGGLLKELNEVLAA